MGSDKLKQSFFRNWMRAHSVLKNKKFEIKITAHTDDVGTEADNLILATNRAPQ